MLQLSGPTSQRLISSGLVWASQTSWAGASNSRTTVTSRSDGVVTVTGLGIGSVLLLRLQVFEQAVEALVGGLPEPAVALDPHVGLLQRRGVDAAGPALGVAAAADQARALQHLQVLGDRRLGHGERLRQFRYR